MVAAAMTTAMTTAMSAAMTTAMSATMSATVSAAVTAFGGSNGWGKCRRGGNHAGCGKGNPSLA
jgi:hypothetical protein